MKRLLGLAAMVVILAGGLVGCAGHGRLASSVQPAAGVPAATQRATRSATAPAKAAPKSTTSTSTSAQLASIQQTVAGLSSTMNSIDGNITQADKAADSDQ
jgi:hypothetical protein